MHICRRAQDHHWGYSRQDVFVGMGCVDIGHDNTRETSGKGNKCNATDAGV